MQILQLSDNFWFSLLCCDQRSPVQHYFRHDCRHLLKLERARKRKDQENDQLLSHLRVTKGSCSFILCLLSHNQLIMFIGSIRIRRKERFQAPHAGGAQHLALPNPLHLPERQARRWPHSCWKVIHSDNNLVVIHCCQVCVVQVEGRWHLVGST